MTHGGRAHGFAFSLVSAGSRCARVAQFATRNRLAGKPNHGVTGIPKGLPASLHSVDRGLGRIYARGNPRLAPTGF